MKTEKLVMKVSELKHPEKNIRRHPQRQVDEMIRSIKMFGQFRDVVVDETNTILAGNGLVVAMREMGKEEADVIKYTGLTEKQKKKLMIADNQVASLGVDDYAAIEEILKSLEGDYDVPGYDEDSIRMLCEETEAVVANVQQYGAYSKEDIDRVKDEADNRAENGFTPVEQTYRPEEDDAATEPKTETQKFVVCPHCGKKIFI